MLTVRFPDFFSLLHQSQITSQSHVRETQLQCAVIWEGLGTFCLAVLFSGPPTTFRFVSVGHRPPSVSVPLLNLSYGTTCDTSPNRSLRSLQPLAGKTTSLKPKSQGSLNHSPPPSYSSSFSLADGAERSVSMTTAELRARKRQPKMTHRI